MTGFQGGRAGGEGNWKGKGDSCTCYHILLKSRVGAYHAKSVTCHSINLARSAVISLMNQSGKEYGSLCRYCFA